MEVKTESADLKATENNRVRNNNVGLGDFGGFGIGGFGMDGFGAYGGGGFGPQTISAPFTLAASNSYSPISLNRVTLSYAYMTQGLVQTVCRQPIDDAFAGGFEIKTDELDEEELKLLKSVLKKNRKRKRNKAYDRLMRTAQMQSSNDPSTSDLAAVKNVLTWASLYGGAGLIVNTQQNFRSELNVEAINEDTELEFIAADRWELILNSTNIWDSRNPTPFNYYGLPLNKTRVVMVRGDEAPAYIRQRLQGWGMSRIEHCIRPINSFLKFETVLFELLDEAKIDIYRIEGFNNSLASPAGEQAVMRRAQIVNMAKNYQKAITMDMKDEYVQKQMSFSGLPEVWNELRLNLSSALRIPMNKLFGQSAGGFSSGQDSIENYNSIVEGERERAEPLLTEVIDLRCQQLFGFIPDYEIDWTPLKELNGVEEQAVLTAKQARGSELYTQGILNPQEYAEYLHKNGIIDQKTEVGDGADPEPPIMSADVDGGAFGSGGGSSAPGAKKKDGGKEEKTPKV